VEDEAMSTELTRDSACKMVIGSRPIDEPTPKPSDCFALERGTYAYIMGPRLMDRWAKVMAYGASMPVIPTTPGIYFIRSTEESDVDYVGQATSLRRRLSPTHHIMKDLPESVVGWMECPEDLLNYYECFYIAYLMPKLNFGGSGKHPR